MARMTHKEMRDTIERGETVVHEGRIIRDVKDLPPESEVAVTAEDKANVLRTMREQHRKLGEEIKAAEADHADTLADEQDATKAQAQVDAAKAGRTVRANVPKSDGK